MDKNKVHRKIQKKRDIALEITDNEKIHYDCQVMKKIVRTFKTT